jgi:hypothetical protein
LAFGSGGANDWITRFAGAIQTDIPGCAWIVVVAWDSIFERVIDAVAGSFVALSATLTTTRRVTHHEAACASAETALIVNCAWDPIVACGSVVDGDNFAFTGFGLAYCDRALLIGFWADDGSAGLWYAGEHRERCVAYKLVIALIRWLGAVVGGQAGAWGIGYAGSYIADAAI